MSDKTILVVDDSKASRLLIVSILKRLLPDYSYAEASNGDEALALAKEMASVGKQFHLAILDMNMPGITGLELAEKMIVNHPKIKLAMLTANTQDAIREAAARLGVHFFKKPVTPTVLSEILQLLG